MQKKNLSPGRALVRTVTHSNLANAIFDVAETALDANLMDGVLKELPVFGTLANLAQAGRSISEEMFVRKLIRFLTALQGVSVEERQKLIEKYPDTSNEQSVLGENLLLAIERLDDIEKPRILARFFSAYLRSEIDYVTFTRLARALEKFNLALLPNLRWYYTRDNRTVESSEEIIHELSLAGLVTVSLMGSGSIGGSAAYLYSVLGQSFLRIGFNIEPLRS